MKDIKDGIEKNSEEINGLIVRNLKDNWSLNRISKINLSLIKLAIYEMLYKELPYKVAINEVVELAKKYALQLGYFKKNFYADGINRIETEKCIDYRTIGSI